jgi:hypothetical protein
MSLSLWKVERFILCRGSKDLVPRTNVGAGVNTLWDTPIIQP